MIKYNVLERIANSLPNKVSDTIKYVYFKNRAKRTLNKKNAKIPPLFSCIEIETINRCNESCPFCPANKNVDIREHKKMDDDLFNKIIYELEKKKYCGSIILSLNNEPFLDERIEEFAKQTKEALPNALVGIITNGTLLTLDRFKKIIPYLDSMVIDNYNDSLKLNATTTIIHEYCKKKPELNKKVIIKLIKKNTARNTRVRIPVGCGHQFR